MSKISQEDTLRLIREKFNFMADLLINVKAPKYGDSWQAGQEILQDLYPNGIPVEHYVPANLMSIMYQKMKRLANGELIVKDEKDENPANDIIGYACLLALYSDHLTKEFHDKENGLNEMARTLSQISEHLTPKLPTIVDRSTMKSGRTVNFLKAREERDLKPTDFNIYKDDDKAGYEIGVYKSNPYKNPPVHIVEVFMPEDYFYEHDSTEEGAIERFKSLATKKGYKIKPIVTDVTEDRRFKTKEGEHAFTYDPIEPSLPASGISEMVIADGSIPVKGLSLFDPLHKKYHAVYKFETEDSEGPYCSLSVFIPGDNWYAVHRTFSSVLSRFSLVANKKGYQLLKSSNVTPVTEPVSSISSEKMEYYQGLADNFTKTENDKFKYTVKDMENSLMYPVTVKGFVKIQNDGVQNFPNVMVEMSCPPVNITICEQTMTQAIDTFKQRLLNIHPSGDVVLLVEEKDGN